jgi:hypothetical protein
MPDLATLPKKITYSKPLFKVGARVRFPRVLHMLEGVIVEDRGNIGMGGRRLYVIQVEVDLSENAEGTLYFTRAESDITAL